MPKTVIVLAAVTVLSSVLLAEEHFGVKVYPNMKTDASTAWYCKQLAPESQRQAKQVAKAPITTSAYCYRTADDFATVAAFYQKHAGLEALGKITNTPSNKTAVFCLTGMKCAALDDGVDVTITSPWADEQKRQTDVLVTIRESRK